MPIAHYFRFFDAAPIPFQSLDQNGTIRYVNNAWCRTLGYHKDDVVGTPFQQLLPDEFHENFPLYIENFFQNNLREKDTNYRIRHHDGEWLDVRFNGSVIRDAALTEPMTQCFFYDISEDIRNKKLYERRYRELFDNAMDGLALYHPIDGGNDFEFVDFNPTAETITRVSKEEVVGRRLLEKFPNMDRTPLLKAMQQVCREGGRVELEPFYYEDTVRKGYRRNRIYRLPSGEIVANFNDVTELEISKTFMKTIFTLENNFICTTIRGEELYDCNAALLDFLGLPSLDAFKKNHHCICECFMPNPEKGYIGPVMDDQNWLDYTLERQSRQTVKTAIEDKGGKTHVFSLHVAPVSYDQKDRFFILLSDITLMEDFQGELHRQLEQKTITLQQTLDLLHKSEQITKSGSWNLDLNDQILRFSKGFKELFRLPEEMHELPLDELETTISQETARQVLQAIESAKKTGSYYTKKHIALPSGETRTIIGVGETIRDASGKAVAIVGISTDNTESERLHKLEQENERLMLQRHKMDSLHDMFSAIAHHWRQPLSVISLAGTELSMEIEELPISEEQRSVLNHNIEMLTQHTQFLSNTINEFAHFAANSNEETLLDISSVLKEIRELYTAKLDDYNITILVEGTPLFVKGNKYEMMRIFSSLIENAREAIEPKQKQYPGYRGIITLGTRENLVTVSDNGIGVQPENREKIFDPYFTTKFMGQGVGLSLYYNMISLSKNFHAQLSLKGSSKEGSCFAISFKYEASENALRG